MKIKNIVIVYVIAAIVVYSNCYAGWRYISLPRYTSTGGDYCSGISWPTVGDDFTLDFDHTTDARTACGTFGSTGTLTDAVVGSPPATFPGSGGNVMVADGDAHYITFDNDGQFSSTAGTIFLEIRTTAATVGHDIFRATGTAFQDWLLIEHVVNGNLQARWEDNNSGDITITCGYDMDNYDGDVTQVQVIWDTGRCTSGDGNCGATYELACRQRVDDNNDGDFSDGGAEDWSSWSYEASDLDLEPFATEPGVGDILFGVIDGTLVDTLYFDDLEVDNAQPTWP